jgi:HemY protein
MLRLVFFLAVSCLLAWAAVWVVNHPGTVVVQWLDRELILSVGTVIAGLLAFAAAAILLFEVVRVLVGLPSSWRISRGRRTQVRGYEELTRGLMAVAAGDLNAARNYHRQAERHLPDNGSLLLLQAQTAQLEGKEEIAHLKFRQMLERRDAEFVGLRGLLAQAMKTGDFGEALTLARRAYRRSPTTPWVLTTLFELLARDKKWDEALPLVDEMQAQGVLDATQAKHKKGVLYHMLASDLRDQDRAADALTQARKSAKADPGFAPGVAQAGELALQAGRRRLALQILEEAWRTAPHPDIARVYAQVDPAESAGQRQKRIDTRLAPLNRTHPETLVLQAEAAMQAGDWSVARSRLEAALDAQPSARVYRLFAEVERQSGGDQAKAREWLARATDAEPDRAWVCDDTGEVLAAWQPLAPSGRFDAVNWSTPPKVATMLGAEQTTYILPPDEAMAGATRARPAPAGAAAG